MMMRKTESEWSLSRMAALTLVYRLWRSKLRSRYLEDISRILLIVALLSLGGILIGSSPTSVKKWYAAVMAFRRALKGVIANNFKFF